MEEATDEQATRRYGGGSDGDVGGGGVVGGGIASKIFTFGTIPFWDSAN